MLPDGEDEGRSKTLALASNRQSHGTFDDSEDAVHGLVCVAAFLIAELLDKPA